MCWLRRYRPSHASLRALLRGIAPSGTNMTNDKLRAVFEVLGLDDVASVLASGNIAFLSDVTDAPPSNNASRTRLPVNSASQVQRCCAHPQNSADLWTSTLFLA